MGDCKMLGFGISTMSRQEDQRVSSKESVTLTTVCVYLNSNSKIDKVCKV